MFWGNSLNFAIGVLWPDIVGVRKARLWETSAEIREVTSARKIHNDTDLLKTTLRGRDPITESHRPIAKKKLPENILMGCNWPTFQIKLFQNF